MRTLLGQGPAALHCGLVDDSNLVRAFAVDQRQWQAQLQHLLNIKAEKGGCKHFSPMPRLMLD